MFVVPRAPSRVVGRDVEEPGAPCGPRIEFMYATQTEYGKANSMAL